MKKEKGEMKEKEIQEKPLDQDEKKEKNKGEEELEKLKREVESLKKEVATWKDKAYRTAADCDNLRKSYEKDHENLLKYRSMGFIERLLPVLDSFHMSLMVKPDDEKLQNYVKGFEMIYRQMLNAMEQEGVSQVSPKAGDLFNPDSMQAIDVKQGQEDDRVLEVYSNGYMLKDRLVRPAMVVVSKKMHIEVEDEEKDESNK